MGINYSPSVITDSLELSLDFANPKNYSYNVHPYPNDITKWITVNSGTTTNCAVSSDSTQISPVGGIPMKMVTSSSDAHITTYNQLKWNLASANVGDAWTASVWVKANTATTIEGPYIFGTTSGGSWTTPGYDIAAGSFNIDTNWKRISVPISMSSANTQAIQIRLDGTQVFTSPVTIWWDGLQVEKSVTATEFNPKTNSAGNTATETLSAANFVFHGDDYWSHTAAGSIVEAQRTNSIRNNTMIGAVAGTPGSAPTNWSVVTPSSGLARQIVGTGTESGISYIDVRYSGTTSAAGLTAIYWESATQVAAVSAQTWTNSVYVALVGGSITNTTGVVVGIDERNGAGDFLAASSTTFVPSAGSLPGKRVSHTRTLTNASTASVWPYVFFSYGSGVAIDITLRIGLPQLELGATATSAIKTKGEARTRYPQKEGTITFDRTLTSSQKFGGGAYRTMTGNLTASKFLYQNHTWEVWFRINDRNPGVYSGLEGFSSIMLYRGNHAGFMYDSSNFYYTIWSGVSTSLNVATWTVGDSGAQINQGSWYQLAVTRSGNVFTPYINGQQLGTGSTNATTNVGILTSDDLYLGKSQTVAANTSNYVYYSKNTIGAVKMYTKALTALEIEHNFNALRGRYGI